MDGGWFAGRDLPVLLKTAEVVQADKVADDADAILAAMLMQPFPLIKEGELQRAFDLQLVGVFLANGVDRSRFAESDGARPLVPALAIESFAQHIEEDKILQPPGVLLTKALEAAVLGRYIRRALQAPSRRLTP